MVWTPLAILGQIVQCVECTDTVYLPMPRKYRKWWGGVGCTQSKDLRNLVQGVLLHSSYQVWLLATDRKPMLGTVELQFRTVNA